MRIFPQKLLLTFVMTLCLNAVCCFADESKWVGIWNSNTMNFVQDKKQEQKGDMKIKYEFILFSDYQSITNMTIYFDFHTDELRVMAECLMSCPGEWTEGNDFTVIPEQGKARNSVLKSEVTFLSDSFNGYYLSDYEKSILESELSKEMVSLVKGSFDLDKLVNEDGEIPIADFKKKVKMTLKKTEVSKPFYYIEPEDNDMTILSIDDTPCSGLVLCSFDGPEADQFSIGVFHRLNLEPCYYCTYSKGGGFVTSFDDYSLSRDEREWERNYCDTYVDSNLCPKSGKGKFKFSNGNIYEGEWCNSQPEGQGKMTFTDGTWRDGTWKGGIFLNGNGKMNVQNGEYTGEMNGDVIEGSGKMAVWDGSFEGQWGEGKFTDGTVIKNGYYDGYEYVGDIKNSSFSSGKCTYSDGCIFEGEWKEMALDNGNVTIPLNGKDYELFVGEVNNHSLSGGSFMSKSGYKVTKSLEKYDIRSQLTITFPNGDQCVGYWDEKTGQILPSSNFDYIWADGIKCSYTVDTKLKMVMPRYYDADGDSAKSKIAKNREKLTTDGEGYSIPVFDEKVVRQKMSRNTVLPKVDAQYL